MPIDVRCPNPECDRVHQVKSKYAGMRGKCPACGSWMLIPEAGDLPSLLAQRRPAAVPAGRAAPRVPAPPASKGHLSAEDFADPPRALPRPRPSREPEQEKPAPPRHFSGFAAFLLFLASVALGGVSLVTFPFLEQPQAQVTGSLRETPLGKLQFGLNPEGATYIRAAAGAAAGLTLLALLLGLVRRRFGAPSLLPAYLALVLAAGMLSLAGWIVHTHIENVEKHTARAQELLAAGKDGTFTVSWGQSLFVGLGCSGGGFALLGLAMLLMHRGLGGRLFLFLVGGALVAAGSALVFARELGFDRPIDLPL